jgi:hypothetical protein
MNSQSAQRKHSASQLIHTSFSGLEMRLYTSVATFPGQRFAINKLTFMAALFLSCQFCLP